MVIPLAATFPAVLRRYRPAQRATRLLLLTSCDRRRCLAAQKKARDKRGQSDARRSPSGRPAGDRLMVR